jgi:predicted ribosome-associated RNA-binding protein Tma20
MTPGLSDAGRGLADGRGRETASLKEGELVGVRATGCEVPLAIGRIGCDGDKLAGMGNGKGKGKAVDLIHCWNDQ